MVRMPEEYGGAGATFFTPCSPRGAVSGRSAVGLLAVQKPWSSRLSAVSPTSITIGGPLARSSAPTRVVSARQRLVRAATGRRPTRRFSFGQKLFQTTPSKTPVHRLARPVDPAAGYHASRVLVERGTPASGRQWDKLGIRPSALLAELGVSASRTAVSGAWPGYKVAIATSTGPVGIGGIGFAVPWAQLTCIGRPRAPAVRQTSPNQGVQFQIAPPPRVASSRLMVYTLRFRPVLPSSPEARCPPCHRNWRAHRVVASTCSGATGSSVRPRKSCIAAKTRPNLRVHIESQCNDRPSVC